MHATFHKEDAVVLAVVLKGANQLFQETAQLNKELFSQFGKVIEDGKADESIRPDFKTPLGIFLLFFLSTGFLNRLAQAGDIYTDR